MEITVLNSCQVSSCSGASWRIESAQAAAPIIADLSWRSQVEYSPSSIIKNKLVTRCARRRRQDGPTSVAMDSCASQLTSEMTTVLISL